MPKKLESHQNEALASSSKSQQAQSSTQSSLFRYIDPSFLACVSFVLIPLFIQGNPVGRTLSLREVSLELTLRHLLNPALIVAYIFLLLGFLITRGKRVRISSADCMRANWYLFNGAIVHIAMDGLTGGFHWWPLLDESYRQLDFRFNDDSPPSWIGKMPNASAVHTAWLTTQLELWVMAPLCLATYWAFHKDFNRGAVHFLEAVVLVLQLCGTWFFVLPEILAGCENLTPFTQAGCMSRLGDFSLYNLLFFWFAFGMNFVWLFVPLFLLYRAVTDSVNVSKGIRPVGDSKKAR